MIVGGNVGPVEHSLIRIMKRTRRKRGVEELPKYSLTACDLVAEEHKE